MHGAGGTGAGQARFDTWLHRVALNLCYDRLRSRRERPVNAVALEDEQLIEAIDGAGLAGIAASMLVASLSLPLTGTPDVLPSIFDHGDADLMLSLDAEESEQ
jgi:DNA-directed RNA polymerase specialized sigma24 family protein